MYIEDCSVILEIVGEKKSLLTNTVGLTINI